ncbi:MAG: type II secretion system F family protein [Gammaproteobacteria bacterium]|nr:type II secretion system F family protein [Gammaproteobacteria bacterium]MDH3534692.1 type II secretion system F family protein [Gammaproteobacteria bacterium]
MPLFQYKAIDASGKFISGSLDAGNINDLELRLEKMDMDLVTYKQKEPGNDLFGRNKIGRRDLINFAFYLEQLTRAGVPILEGLADLRDGEENPTFRDIVTGLIEAIEGGNSFSQALALYPRIFDEVFVSLIRVGERTGRMSDVLVDITTTLKWQDELLAKARKIVMYPAVIGSLVFSVIMFMMIFIVPDIMDAIVGLGGEIPIETRALMATSHFLVNYWYVVLAAPFVTFFTTKYFYNTSSKARFRLDGLMLKLFLIGPVSEKIKISRFTRYFSLMFASGITVLDAINLSKAVVGNAVLEDGIERAWQQISEGSSISEAFKNIGIFPPLVVRMLRVGESSGQMDKSLNNVSYFFDRDINDSIDKLEPVLQTTLMATIGVVVLWLALSVLGPIYDTISTIDF